MNLVEEMSILSKTKTSFLHWNKDMYRMHITISITSFDILCLCIMLFHIVEPFSI